MKHTKLSGLLAVLLLGLGGLTSSSAWAQHSHGHHIHYGFYVGVPGPFIGGPFYPYPYYPPMYYPQPQVIVQSPPVYIEQSQPAPAPAPAPAASAPSAYWYYCSNPQGYYPYVKQCSTAWQPVAPQPPTNTR